MFDNHLNRSSAQLRLLRLFRRPDARLSMAQEEVDAMLADTPLRVVRVYPIGLVPAKGRRVFLPFRLLALLERTASRVGWFKPLFEDLVFVCRKCS